MPGTQVFTARFGGLAEAYNPMGFNPRRKLAYVARDRALTPLHVSSVRSKALVHRNSMISDFSKTSQGGDDVSEL